jgi:hypothetical protein
MQNSKSLTATVAERIAYSCGRRGHSTCYDIVWAIKFDGAQHLVDETKDILVFDSDPELGTTVPVFFNEQTKNIRTVESLNFERNTFICFDLALTLHIAVNVWWISRKRRQEALETLQQIRA